MSLALLKSSGWTATLTLYCNILYVENIETNLLLMFHINETKTFSANNINACFLRLQTVLVLYSGWCFVCL